MRIFGNCRHRLLFKARLVQNLYNDDVLLCSLFEARMCLNSRTFKVWHVVKHTSRPSSISPCQRVSLILVGIRVRGYSQGCMYVTLSASAYGEYKRTVPCRPGHQACRIRGASGWIQQQLRLSPSCEQDHICRVCPLYQKAQTLALDQTLCKR
jgi:hypothetical protein